MSSTFAAAIYRLAGLLVLALLLPILGNSSGATARIDLPIVKQGAGTADCNPASVAMILGWYQQTGQLASDAPVDFASVLAAFERLGGASGPYAVNLNAEVLDDLVGDQVRMTPEWLETTAEMKSFLEEHLGNGVPVQMIMNPPSLPELPYPTTDWPGGHSMVIFDISGDSVTYADPWPSEFPDVRTVSLDELDRLWRFRYGDSFTRYAMVYVPSHPAFLAPTDFAVGVAHRDGFGYRFNIRWTDRSDNEDGFKLYYRPEGGTATPWFGAAANDQSAERSGLNFDNDTPYRHGICYWIVATREGVESPPSNESCLDKWEDEDTFSDPPDGSWLEAPLPGTRITDGMLRLGARAFPTNGPPIQRVEFTIWWPAVGPSTGPWRLGCTVTEPVLDDLFRCDVNLSQVPDGDFRISFDVYDESGRYTLAPGGTRALIRDRDGGNGGDGGTGSGDRDNDGIEDGNDRCPDSAEDKNGYEDTDGCPDGGNPDPDGDGIEGGLDQCPNEREDVDGDRDSDGCPDSPGVTAPAAPASASIRALSGDRFEVTWVPGSNNHTGFRIKGTAGTTLGTISQAGARSATLNNPNPGQQMCVNVFAYNSAGESPARYAGCAQPQQQPPAAPASASIRALSGDRFEVTWTPGSNDQTGFRIKGTGGTTLGTINQAGARSATLNNPNPGQQMCVNVFAFNSAGESPGKYAGCAQPIGQVPAAPSNVRVSMECPDRSCGWDFVSWDDNSSNESGFRVYIGNAIYRSVGPDVESIEIDPTDWANLEASFGPSELYCFTVTSYNVAGESVRSANSACMSPPLLANHDLTGWVLPNSVLQLGQAFEICYHLTPDGTPHTIRVMRSINGGPFEPNAQVNDDGYGGDCLTGTVSGATGIRTYRIEAIVGGTVVDQVQLTVTVTGSGGGEPGSQYQLDAWLNKSAYVNNESFTLCFELTPQVASAVHVSVSANGGPFNFVQTVYDDEGDGACFNGVMGAPGGRVIRLEAYVQGKVVASKELSVIVFGTIGGSQ